MSSDTTTEAAFIASILAAPADDLPRLVFADWLDEHPTGPCRACGGTGFDLPIAAGLPRPTESRDASGRLVLTQVIEPFMWKMPKCKTCGGAKTADNGNAARAEWIRVQCEIATLCKKTRAGVVTPEESERQAALFDRERELLRTTTVHEDTVGVTSDWLKSLGVDPYDCVFNRGGFLGTVRCTLASWCGSPTAPTRGHNVFMARPDTPFAMGAIGPRVVASHPVTRVTLTDREPLQIENRRTGTLTFVWVDDGDPAASLVWEGPPRVELFERHQLPATVMTNELRRPFANEGEAMGAASERLIAWAKEQNRPTVADIARLADSITDYTDSLTREIARGLGVPAGVLSGGGTDDGTAATD